MFLSNYFVVLFSTKKRTPRARERDLPVDVTDALKNRGERRDGMEWWPYFAEQRVCLVSVLCFARRCTRSPARYDSHIPSFSLPPPFAKSRKGPGPPVPRPVPFSRRNPPHPCPPPGWPGSHREGDVEGHSAAFSQPFAFLSSGCWTPPFPPQAKGSLRKALLLACALEARTVICWPHLSPPHSGPT